MIQPRDVVIVQFAGAVSTKRRPCVVLSSSVYHSHRPDVILAIITSKLADAVTPTDYVLQDWQEAGLTMPSAVRSYISTYAASVIQPVGRLTERDWLQVQERVSNALFTS